MGSAFVQGLVAGVVAMFASLLLALLLPFPALSVVTAWFQFGAFVALAAGALVYRLALTLTPIRPQARFNKSANADPQPQKAATPEMLRSGCFQR